MTMADDAVSRNTAALTNGTGAAAILSAGVGCFALALLAVLGDKYALVKSALVFYKPTGPLSGVTTVAILVWLSTWGILDWRWRKTTVRVRLVGTVALALLGLSLLLTFPPFVALF